MTDRAIILKRWRLIRPHLDSRQRSLWAAAEAAAIERGGCKLMAQITGLSSATISEWKRKLQLGRRALPGSLAQPQRSPGAGRKACEVKDPDMVPALELMLKD
jgi:hypothetical protein